MWDAEDNNGNILELCPFCGAGASIQEDDIETVIECSLCEASMYRHSGNGTNHASLCRAAWNRRT